MLELAPGGLFILILFAQVLIHGEGLFEGGHMKFLETYCIYSSLSKLLFFILEEPSKSKQ